VIWLYALISLLLLAQTVIMMLVVHSRNGQNGQIVPPLVEVNVSDRKRVIVQLDQQLVIALMDVQKYNPVVTLNAVDGPPQPAILISQNVQRAVVEDLCLPLKSVNAQWEEKDRLDIKMPMFNYATT